MKQLSPNEVKALLDQNPELQLIDVREPYEHEEFNIGGRNIPLATLAGALEDIRSMSQKGDIVLYCRSGNRSLMAQKILSMQFQIDNTINLTGGMIGWQEMMRE